MRITVLIVIALLLAACSAAPSCQSKAAVANSVIVPRLAMPGAAGRHSLLYRNDPECETCLLLCPVRLAGDVGEDPYADPEGSEYAGTLMAFRCEPGGSVLRLANDDWTAASTPVGHAYLSRIGGSQEIGEFTQRWKSPITGQQVGFSMWSPNDPASETCVHDGFGGVGATHLAILSGASRDQRGVIPGTGGALRGPYYVQVFRKADGVQVGPTYVLELGEKTLFEPTGGWTYDGRFIVLHYPMTGHLWIIPTPEVLEARRAK